MDCVQRLLLKVVDRKATLRKPNSTIKITRHDVDAGDNARRDGGTNHRWVCSHTWASAAA